LAGIGFLVICFVALNPLAKTTQKQMLAVFFSFFLDALCAGHERGV
jgi:hypothetical protein